jgi:hypothetical protein
MATTLKRNAPMVLFGLAALAASVLLLALDSALTFYQDSYAFLVRRQDLSADSLFSPHNEHIVVLPVAIYRTLIEIFGMDSAWPEQVINTALLAAAAIVLFAYVRRRVGDWLALFAAIVILFFGPGWNVLIWEFQIGFSGSMAAGVAMLLALDRRDRFGDIAACLLLVVSMAFSSVGVAFAVGAVVDVWLRRDEGVLRRAFVPGVGLVLFAAWYLGYGHEAESTLSVRSVATSPAYVFDGLAASLDSLLGLNSRPVSAESTGDISWGRPLLVALVVLVAVLWLPRHRMTPRIWVVAAIALTFWGLAAANFVPGRDPESSRYMYMGAVLLVLLLAEIFNGVRPSNRILAVFAVATTAAVASNLVLLTDGKRYLAAQSQFARADIGALEIARDVVHPKFLLDPSFAGTPSLVDVQAGPYFEAADAHGYLGDSPAQIFEEPEHMRERADDVLVHALRLGVIPVPLNAPVPGGPPTIAGADHPLGRQQGSCLTLPGGTGEQMATLQVGPPGPVIHLSPGEPAQLGIRRFSRGDFPVVLADIAGGDSAKLRIPPDRSRVPWELGVQADQEVSVCGAGA